MPDSRMNGRSGRVTLRAFSLFELVIVLVVLGLLAVVAAPRFASSMSRYEAETVARQFAADVRYAQQRARAESRAWRVVLAGDGSSWVVEAVPEVVSGGAVKGVPLGEESAESIGPSAGVSMPESALADRGVSVEIEGSLVKMSRALVFDAFGMPNDGAKFVFTRGDASSWVLVSDGGVVTSG